jgi:catalase
MTTRKASKKKSKSLTPTIASKARLLQTTEQKDVSIDRRSNDAKIDDLQKNTEDSGGEFLTTNQGVRINDNQNSLKAGDRGPSLLEDFILREKITHFDHERIPERVVHRSWLCGSRVIFRFTSRCAIHQAGFLQDPSVKTPGLRFAFRLLPVLVARATSPVMFEDSLVKFYTQQGNFDIVGNNMPVVLYSDAMKFPDLSTLVKPSRTTRYLKRIGRTIHSGLHFINARIDAHDHVGDVGPCDSPKSSHDGRFWCSYVRLINEAVKSRFVKFHWKPVLVSIQ